MYDLTGKVAVITGVGRPRGIGRATALRFAQEGAHVVLADLGTGMQQISDDIQGVSPDLAQVAGEIEAVGAQMLAVPTDVSQPDDVERLLQRTVDQFGKIDIMVCNAAIIADQGINPLELPNEVFSRVLAVNLTGTFLCAQAAARRMVAQGQGGKIVTVSSRAGRRGSAQTPAYSSSKFGVIGLTQSLAMALAPHGIRVNCVCPGAVDTDMGAPIHEQRAIELGASPETARDEAARTIPLGRLTTGDDLAKAIVWLSSSETDHITGQALNVTGGSLMN